jgi:type IV fimbrial biogenesis protein FimT
VVYRPGGLFNHPAQPGTIERMRKRDLLHSSGGAAGFTLVELMVTVAIVAILMAIGAPQLQSFLQKQRVAADVNSLTAAVQLARSEALKRNGRVSMCALTSGDFTVATAAQCSAGATSWANGWLIYIDYSNGAGFNSATDTVIKVERNTRSPVITGTGLGGLLSFQSNGLAVSNPGSFVITPVDVNDPLCVKLNVNRQGRVTKDSTCKAPASTTTTGG